MRYKQHLSKGVADSNPRGAQSQTSPLNVIPDCKKAFSYVGLGAEVSWTKRYKKYKNVHKNKGNS